MAQSLGCKHVRAWGVLLSGVCVSDSTACMSKIDVGEGTVSILFWQLQLLRTATNGSINYHSTLNPKP